MHLQKPNFIELHQDIAQTPQDHLSTALLGPCNITSQVNSHALTAVCNLTGYLMTTPIKDQKTTPVANHLFSDIILKFSFPRILHSDNGTEFKSKLMENLFQQHSLKKLSFPLTIHKQMENWNFIKACILKFSLDGVLERDQLPK